MTTRTLLQPLLGGLLIAVLHLQGCAMPLAPEDEAGATTGSTKSEANSPEKSAKPKSKSKPKSAPTEAKATQQTTPQPSIDNANILLKQGRKQEAADMYYRSAYGFPSPQRERIILQAAEIAASSGDTRTTNSYLAKVPRRALQGENLPRYQYILALLALQNKQPNQALRLIPQNIAQLPAGLRDKVLLVRKRSIEMGGTPVAADTAIRPPNGIVAQPGAPEAPATQAAEQNILPTASNKLAVLLPQSGALGAVSQEIYQGIQDAQKQYGPDTRSKMYDVNAATALQQYRQAVADGADVVIGPLDKDSLAALMANPAALTVPVLSLNYSTSGRAPASVYQFGLSPEDEARQIAGLAIGRGQNQALVMVPDSSWGKRLAEAFAETYRSRGGQVLLTSSYPNAASSGYLQKVQNALANAPGAQMVFLGASPTQARLIRPLLQAQAGLLPVYATSHIYSGRPEKGKDVDLDGIIYTEIPMILDGTAQGSLNTLKYPRLYALGADAVLIAKNLSGLTQQKALSGKTGEIRLGGNRNIQRSLSIATFINGLPSALGN